jgi:hypothetical protein
MSLLFLAWTVKSRPGPALADAVNIGVAITAAPTATPSAPPMIVFRVMVIGVLLCRDRRGQR